MRKFLFPLILAAVLVAAARAVEPVDLLTWRQPVLGQIVSGKVYRVMLSPEVFNGCRSFPADIRILDEARRAWPFFLWTPEVRDVLAPIFATLGRKTSGAGGLVVQEVSIRVDDPKVLPRHNQVSILTGGHDFIRRVEVLGSTDGVTWKELGSGSLVDQMQPSRVSNRIVTYEPSTSQRLLLRIHPGSGHEDEAIEILDVQVAWHSRTAEPMQQISLVPIAIQASEVQEGVLTLAYDTGAQNRPIESLRIRVGEGDFVLPVKVFGRNGANDPWRWVADGGVYRIGRDVRDTVELNGAAFRQIKIDLFRSGTKQPPIATVIAEAQPHYLVLESRGGSTPMLHYGADKIPLPRYDLQRRTSAADISSAPLLHLGAASSNPHKVANGLSAYLRTMGGVAVVIVACISLVIALRFLRSRLW